MAHAGQLVDLERVRTNYLRAGFQCSGSTPQDSSDTNWRMGNCNICRVNLPGWAHLRSAHSCGRSRSLARLKQRPTPRFPLTFHFQFVLSFSVLLFSVFLFPAASSCRRACQFVHTLGRLAFTYHHIPASSNHRWAQLFAHRYERRSMAHSVNLSTSGFVNTACVSWPRDWAVSIGSHTVAVRSDTWALLSLTLPQILDQQLVIIRRSIMLSSVFVRASKQALLVSNEDSATLRA